MYVTLIFEYFCFIYVENSNNVERKKVIGDIVDIKIMVIAPTVQYKTEHKFAIDRTICDICKDTKSIQYLNKHDEVLTQAALTLGLVQVCVIHTPSHGPHTQYTVQYP